MLKPVELLAWGSFAAGLACVAMLAVGFTARESLAVWVLAQCALTAVAIVIRRATRMARRTTRSGGRRRR